MDQTEGHDQTSGLAQYLHSPVVKRSVMVAGHATSVSLEEPFWVILGQLATAQNKSLNVLITEIDDLRGPNNLSSALRLYALREHPQKPLT